MQNQAMLELLTENADERLKNRRLTFIELPKRAQAVHDTVHAKIKKLWGENVGGLVVPKTRVLIDPKSHAVGCLLPRESYFDCNPENLDIIVDYMTGKLKESSEDLQEFRKLNEGTRIEPEDYLGYVLAHEYGHITEYAQVGERPDIRPDKRIAVSEAFAHWFGELMTGFKTFTEEIARSYEEIGANSAVMISVYNSLKSQRSNCDKKVKK